MAKYDPSYGDTPAKKTTTAAPPPAPSYLPGVLDPNDPTVRAQLAALNPGGAPITFGAPPGIDWSGVPGTNVDTTDYAANIANDPIYAQLVKDLSAQGVQDAASRKASTDQALINFGEIPDLASVINGLGLDPNSPMFKMLFGDIDEATTKSAKALTDAGLSTTAKLNQGHLASMADLFNNLAARGSVRSGASGVGTNLEGQRYLGAQYDARQQLLQYLTGVQSAFSDAERARQGQLTAGAGDATTRQIALHPSSTGEAYYPNAPAAPAASTLPPPPPSTAPLPPSVSLPTGAPQSKTFGGTSGPYIGTLAPRLNLPK